MTESLPESQPELDWLAKHVRERQAPRREYARRDAGHRPNTDGIPPGDGDLLRRIFASANGAQINRVWTGDLSEFDGDASRADLSLFNHLLWWCGNDPARAEALFRQSGLFRPKWDERHASDGRTYGQLTIEKSLSGKSEPYSPRGARAHSNGNGSANWQANGAASGEHGKQTEKPADPRFDFIVDTDFANGDYRPTWGVQGVLVLNEPGVIAGPVKSMKTTLMIELAISLACALAFLGKFIVPRRHTVAVVSGESGRATLQSAAKRVRDAKGIGPIENLHWCFEVPVLSDLASMGAFVDELVSRGVTVVFLDPLYLMLGDVDAKNMFETGAVLRNVSVLLLGKGITPILLHHANRQLPIGEVMELQHLAYSGCDQFMRQFILLNRREKYMQDGNHALWMRIGGSAGHGGLYGLDIEEGTLDEHFGGRIWRTEVTDATVIRSDDTRDGKTAEKERSRLLGEKEVILKAIESERSKGHPAATKNALKEQTGWKTPRLSQVLDRLLEDSTLEEHTWKKEIGKNATRGVVGYRIPVKSEQPTMEPDHTGPVISPDDRPASPDDPRSGEGTSGDHAGHNSPCRGECPASPDDPEPPISEEYPKTSTKKKRKNRASPA